MDQVQTPEVIPVPGKPLGRSIDGHDPENRRFPMAAVLDRPKPRKTREWWRRDLFDQNVGGPWNGFQAESSCTFQAVAGLLVASPARMNRVVHSRLRDLLDPAFRYKAYRLAQDLDEWHGSETSDPRYAGSSGLAAMKAAKALEVVPADWEYRWYFEGVDEIKEGLHYGPVAVGTIWTEGMDNPDAKGVVRNSGRSRGGHEWYIGDYEEKPDLYDAWNSWGPGYGLRGRFKVPGSVLVELLDEGGDAVSWVPPS